MNENKEDIQRLVSLFEKRKINKKKNEHFSDDTFKIAKINESNNAKFHTIDKVYELVVNRQSNTSFIDFIQSLLVVFKYLLNVARTSVRNDNDYVRFIFNRAPRSYFSTPFTQVKDLRPEYFVNVFEKHMQSNKHLIADGWKTEVIVQVLHNESSGAKRKKKNKLLNKKRIYKNLNKAVDDEGGANKTIRKYDRAWHTGVFFILTGKLLKDACFMIALLVSLAFLSNEEKGKIILRNPTRKLDEFFTDDDVRDMYRRCGLFEGRVKVADFPNVYEKFLKPQGIDLLVFSDAYDDTIIYDSRTDDNGQLLRLTNNIVCLWLNNKHYDVVLNICEFSKINPSMFCIKCMSYFSRGEYIATHRCKTNLTCQKCYKLSSCLPDGCKTECTSCNVLFFNRTCFENHLWHKVFQPQKSNHGLLTPCQYMFFCQTCNKIAPRFTFISKGVTKKHKCNEVYCVHCDKKFASQHLCYMKEAKLTNKKTYPTLFFFDFETYVSADRLLTPFYCVVQKVCRECAGIDVTKNELPQKCCGQREFVFAKNGASIVDIFCEFMLMNENSVWIAHNGGRFDTIFIYKYLLEVKKIIPESVLNGTKIMTLHLPKKNIRFLDSYLFLTMPLAAIPKSMGIDNICKGFHPYKFYNLDYEGKIVERHYFDVDNMSSENKAKFETWYATKSNEKYIFKNEIYYYCADDVNILRKGCLKFSQMLENASNVVPFYDTTMMTIASTALKVYRLNFLKPKSIGLLPASGYRGKTAQSLIALLWLKEIDDTLHGMLEYRCSRHGERKVLGRFVDGFYNNVVYQFHGCFFHGCPTCYHPYDRNKINNEKYTHLYAKTQKFTHALIGAGYTVVEMWECVYLAERKLTQHILKEKKRQLFAYVPLEPRDALYGGRTSPVCLYKCVDDDVPTEKIKYVDFTSLYPAVQKFNMYPIGHPTVLVNDECDTVNARDVFGLIKCSILPPQDLYFAVLPMRANGRLLFPLCRLCAETCTITPCDHDERERALHGCWTSVEIIKAMDKGYRILKIYEIYNYAKKTHLFGDYVNCFLKLKQESSGLPAECKNADGTTNDDALDTYCDDYLRHEGIQLDKANIKKNPGLRTIAKMLLNSLWGKFAQNENNTKVCFLDDYEELLYLCNNMNIEVTSLDFVNDTLTRCTYVDKETANAPLKTTNVIIASFVTSYARIQLFDLIDKLQKRVLYFDTDSVIYTCDEKIDASLPLGNYLGELTDELAAGEWITQFCSTGPKAYSYVTNTGKENVCVKGFSLKNDTLKAQLNFTSITGCVKDKNQIINVNYANKICRDKRNHIFNEDELKQFTFTFNKRVVKDDFYTLPYGFLDA